MNPLDQTNSKTPRIHKGIYGYGIMDPLDKTIAEIKDIYAGVSESSVFVDLLEREKKGKRRKVLKRWLREMIKSLKAPHSLAERSKRTLSLPNDDPEFKVFEREFIAPSKPPKDPITGIPIIR